MVSADKFARAELRVFLAACLYLCGLLLRAETGTGVQICIDRLIGGYPAFSICAMVSETSRFSTMSLVTSNSFTRFCEGR